MLRILAIPALVCLADTALAGVGAAEITYQSCRTCHETAEGATMPTLAGRSAEDLAAAFAAMAASPASQTIMHRFTSGLTEAELADLVTFIASQPKAAE